MSKKIFIPIAIVVTLAVAAGAFGMLAYANAAQPDTSTAAAAAVTKGGFGQVTAVGQDTFTVKNKTTERNLQVNSQTRFTLWNGEKGAFSDLKTNGLVIVRVSKQSDGSLLAMQVVLMPQGFDGTQIDQRAAGLVTTVNAAAGKFSLKTRNSQEVSYTTSSSTIFLGKVNDLSLLKVGMAVSVGGVKQSDGTLLAVVIAARQPLTRHVGKITTIDLAASTFIVQTAKGGSITYQVGADTTFRGAAKGLNELKTGMAVIVTSNGEANGSQAAVTVLAGDPNGLRPGKWSAGTVTSVSSKSFTIQNLLGKAMTIQVNEATRFFSAGQKVKSLDDLSAGMIVLIHYQRQANNDLLAKQVVAKAQ